MAQPSKQGNAISPVERIRELNDAFRHTRTGGRVLPTRGVIALGPEHVSAIVNAVAGFLRSGQRPPWRARLRRIRNGLAADLLEDRVLRPEPKRPQRQPCRSCLHCARPHHHVERGVLTVAGPHGSSRLASGRCVLLSRLATGSEVTRLGTAQRRYRDKIQQVHGQCGSEPVKEIDCWVELPLFDAADVCAVHASIERQAFLSEALRGSNSPQVPSDARTSIHGGDAINLLALKPSNIFDILGWSLTNDD